MTQQNTSKKILIIIPKRLGEAIFRTPLIRFIHSAVPGATIDIIAMSPLAAAVFKNNPYVRKIYVDGKDEINLTEKYDLLLNTDGIGQADKYIKSFEITPHCVEGCIDCSVQEHIAEHILHFFSERLRINQNNFDSYYELFPKNENTNKIKKLLGEQGDDSHQHTLIGLHIGCHGLAKYRSRLWNKYKHEKAWPIKNFIELASSLKQDNPNLKFVLTGSAAEEKVGKIFCDKIAGSINLINKTSILDLAALMSVLKVFISNDTGVMHIACATSIPLITLFGHSNPKITGPYPKTEKRIILHKPNIEKITVTEVLNVTKTFLEQERD